MTKYLLHGVGALLLLFSASSCRLGYGSDDNSDAAPEVMRTFCEQLNGDWGYNYCRDFDDEEPFDFGWDTRVSDPGAVVQSDISAFSAPAAFLAKVPVTDPDGTCLNAYSESKGSGDSDFMQLNFQMRMGTMEGQTPFAGAFMTLRATEPDGAETCSFTIYGDGASGGVLQSASVGAVHPFTVRFPLEYEWTKVALNVDFRDSTFDLELDGQTAFSDRQTIDPNCVFNGSFVVSPGIHCAGQVPVATGEVRLDNISMSYNPVSN